MIVKKHLMENQRTGKKIKISAWADAVVRKKENERSLGKEFKNYCHG